MINVKRATPEDFGYKDRGIMKWMGMMLSDHSEALKKESIRYKAYEVKAKTEMSESQISIILYEAFLKQYPVSIQANIMRNGSYYKDVVCKVSGYTEDQIYLVLKDNRTVNCRLEDIRSIEWLDIVNWYN